jgi:hypothetical protein
MQLLARYRRWDFRVPSLFFPQTEPMEAKSIYPIAEIGLISLELVVSDSFTMLRACMNICRSCVRNVIDGILVFLRSENENEIRARNTGTKSHGNSCRKFSRSPFGRTIFNGRDSTDVEGCKV